jgi:hypothetical protein
MQLEVGLPVDAYLLGAHRLVITVRYFPPDQRQAVPSVWKQILAREGGSPKGQDGYGGLVHDSRAEGHALATT